MPKVKQPNSSKLKNMLYEYALSLPQQVRVKYFANSVTA